MEEVAAMILSNENQLQNLGDDWERLWRMDPDRTVFGSIRWAQASWKAYGDGSELCISVVKKGDKVVAILPLYLSGGRLIFLGAPRSDYNDILCEHGAEEYAIEAAFRTVASSRFGRNRLELENVSESSQLVHWFHSGPPDLKRRMHLTFRTLCPRVVGCSSNPDVMTKILKKKSLKRHENRLQRQGQLTFRHLHRKTEIADLLPVLFNQHIARWAVAGESSLFLKRQNRVFFMHLVELLDTEKELRFGLLELDGSPLALHFGFQNDQQLVWYKPSFSINWWDFSPGEVLLRALFKYVAAESLEELDFTVGNEGFKRRYANETQNNYTLSVFCGVRGMFARRMQIERERVKRFRWFYKSAQCIVSYVQRLTGVSVSAARKHGVVGIAKKITRELFRRLVYAFDEVCVFGTFGSCTTESGNTLPEHVDNIDVIPGSFSDLAILAAHHPGQLEQSLAKARDRLKTGCKIHLTRRRSGDVVHVAWTRMSSSITDSKQVGDDCRVELNAPGVVIFDCWTPPKERGHGYYAKTIRSLVQHAKNDGCETWIYCRRDNIPSMRGIEKAGLRLTHRMQRYRIMGIFTRRRVIAEIIGENMQLLDAGERCQVGV